MRGERRRRCPPSPISGSIWWAFTLCFAVVGCGRPATTVTGVVSLDGQPLEKAIVQFQPERANDRPAVVLTDALGRYRVAVAPVPFRVMIICQRVAGQRKEGPGPDGVMVDVVEDVVPEEYMRGETTPLRVEPQAGRSTVVDISLPGRK